MTNKMMKIVILLIIICLTISIYFVINNLTNYTQKVEKSDTLLIGVSQPNLSDPWRVVMTNEIKAEIENYENIRVIFTDAAHDAVKQMDDIDKLMGYGIDLLIVSMTDTEVLTPKVSEIYSEIPVIVLDRDVLGYDYSLFIGLDNYMIGQEAGRFVLNNYNVKNTKLIEVMGDKDSLSTVGRTNGFEDIINGSFDDIMIERLECNWKKDKAQDELTHFIKSNDVKPDLIYSHSDAMAYGAYLALSDLGIKDVDIIGMDALDGVEGGIELVKHGILKSTYTCPTGGKEAVRYAVELLNNEEIMPKKIILRSYEVTKNNVENYIDKSIIVDKSPEEITMGFAQIGAESSWRNANSESILTAAQDVGINIVFRNVDDNLSDEQKQQKQIEFIEGFIEQKVDVIAFSPIVKTGWEDVLLKAKEADIPVILSDREVVADTDLWTSFIGSDFEEEGRRAALWMMDNTVGSCNIVELKGTKGATPTIDRQNGFDEIIANRNEYKIIFSKIANYKKADGKQVMKEALDIYGDDIDVVYSHNDDMALGAIEAIEEYGLVAGKDIILISIDATKEAFNAMVIGKLNCAVECNPLLGPQIMKSVLQLASGKEIPIRIITEESVYTSENAKDYINVRKY